jgi:hypothetical protein
MVKEMQHEDTTQRINAVLRWADSLLYEDTTPRINPVLRWAVSFSVYTLPVTLYTCKVCPFCVSFRIYSYWDISNGR